MRNRCALTLMFGSIFARSGKILDSNGNLIMEDSDLMDGNAKSRTHPLNDLHDLVWNRESGESVSGESKFPETLKIEEFTEELKAQYPQFRPFSRTVRPAAFSFKILTHLLIKHKIFHTQT